MSLFLAIDQGTHASRALLFNDRGEPVGSRWREIGLQRHAGGRVEQDARQLLQSVSDAVSALLDSLDKAQRNQIAACGLCTQRSTVVACRRSGEAIGPVLSWQDVRGADFLQSLKARHRDIQALSGLPVSAHYGASKLHWLRQHLPADIPPDQVRLAPLVSFLLLNLLEQHPYYVDHTNAQRTQLMALRTLDWSDSLLNWFEIPLPALPAIKPMCYDYGRLIDTPVPVTAVCGDQNAALFGTGELPADTALINLGSGAFVLRRLPALQTSRRQLSGISYSDSDTVEFLREGTINGAGNALNWAKTRFQLGDLKRLLPGWLEAVAQPPVFINTVGGLGSPWWVRDLAPQWVGDRPENRAAIASSVIESILFLVQDNLNLMQTEKPLTRLRVSGGLSQLDGLCQKLANLSGLAVERVDNPEATARGVAWLAAGRPGHWRPDEFEHFSPRQDPGIKKRYQIFCAALASLIRDNTAP